MIDRSVRTGAALCMLLSMQFASANAQNQGPSPTPSGVVTNVIVPRLETDRSRYLVGQPILLRISVTNVTSTDYDVMLDSFNFTSMGELTVRNSSGKLVKPQNSPTFWSRSAGHSYMPLMAPLRAGETKVLKWMWAEGQQLKEQEWIELSNWGYAQLGAGSYTITYLLYASGHAHIPGTSGRPDDYRWGPTIRTSDNSGNGARASVKITVVP